MIGTLITLGSCFLYLAGGVLISARIGRYFRWEAPRQRYYSTPVRPYGEFQAGDDHEIAMALGGLFWPFALTYMIAIRLSGREPRMIREARLRKELIEFAEREGLDLTRDEAAARFNPLQLDPEAADNHAAITDDERDD